jgi:hypothetical protein
MPRRPWSLTRTCFACNRVLVCTDPAELGQSEASPELVYYRAPDREHRSGWYLVCPCGAGTALRAVEVPLRRRTALKNQEQQKEYSMEKIFAPWTEAQVAGLKIRQRDSGLHPYTCVAHSATPLVPSRLGFECAFPGCGYRQNWALAIDTRGGINQGS